MLRRYDSGLSSWYVTAAFAFADFRKGQKAYTEREKLSGYAPSVSGGNFHVSRGRRSKGREGMGLGSCGGLCIEICF